MISRPSTERTGRRHIAGRTAAATHMFPAVTRMLPAAVLLLLLIALPRARALAQLPDSLRVVVLGSSTAAGAGASVRDSAWVWRYDTYLKSLDPDYDAVNLAVGGYTTYHIQPEGYVPPQDRPAPDIHRNITAAIALRPSAIIINLPSNDAAKNYSIIEQAQNFERVAGEAATAGIPLWVCTTQPRNMNETQRQNLMAMRDWITGTYADHVLDFWSGLATGAGMMLPEFNSGDGVHLNDAGHRLLFERVRDARIPERLQTTALAALPDDGHVLELAVYPQPARDVVTFRIDGDGHGSWTLVVRDLIGQEVYRAESGSHPGVAMRQLNAAQLPRGLYHVLLRTGSSIRSAPLLLVR